MMPKNLREKLALVLEDCQDLKQYELLNRLERVVNEELNFLANDHKVDTFDLTQIRSLAINNYNQLNMSQSSLGKAYGDGELVRTLCMVDSVISFLRSKGLVNFTITFNKK
jgi:hypothetical protein